MRESCFNHRLKGLLSLALIIEDFARHVHDLNQRLRLSSMPNVHILRLDLVHLQNNISKVGPMAILIDDKVSARKLENLVFQKGFVLTHELPQRIGVVRLSFSHPFPPIGVLILSVNGVHGHIKVVETALVDLFVNLLKSCV
jgi:hypothetical protein